MKELELYIHIPFCVRKCAYCDFLSGPAGEPEREEYLEALVKEIRSAGDMGRGCQVSSVFLGGGTPSILTPEQIGGILYAVRETFTLAIDAEITMEYNPCLFYTSYASAAGASGDLWGVPVILKKKNTN